MAGSQERPANRNGTRSRRDAKGRFIKGKSGNPDGRPKSDQTIIDLAREKTEVALETLVGIMQDGKAPASARVAAAGHILDRGWGRPRQAIDLGSEGGAGLAVKVEWVDPKDVN